MRLLDFYIAGYRNLHNMPLVFSMDDDQDLDDRHAIRFLIGRNGQGKSNILRFLSAIFTAIEDGYTFYQADNPAYGARFQLRYRLYGQTITISSAGQGRAGVHFSVGDQLYEAGVLPGPSVLLPNALVIYTSGELHAWRRIFRQLPPGLEEEEEAVPPESLVVAEEENPVDEASISTMDYPEDSLERDQNPPATEGRSRRRNVFLIEPTHMPLALLAAFIQYYVEQAHFPQQVQASQTAGFGSALETVGVSRLVSFSFRLSDPNLSVGQDRAMLHHLSELATLKLDEWGSQLWVFDMDEVHNQRNLSQRLASRFVQGLETPAADAEAADSDAAGLQADTFSAFKGFRLFRELVDLQSAGMLLGVNMAIRKQHSHGTTGNDTERLLLTENLSDGEAMFLERMALIYLFKEEECLFILDEPETHFNDAWKRNLVNMIDLTLVGTNSEVVLTTHESITLTDAFPKEVVLLGDAGQEPVPHTLGTEPGELIRSLFEAPNSVGARAIRQVEAAIERQDPTELQQLLNDVGPGYLRFRIVEELGDNAPRN